MAAATVEGIVAAVFGFHPPAPHWREGSMSTTSE